MPPKKKVEPVGPPPEGFAAVPGTDRIVAVSDVLVSFVPRNATRESTILLFAAGQVIDRKAYDHRLEMYAGYTSLEVK